MPELPEVETYRRFIDELAVGQTITAFEVRDAHVLATPEDQLRTALVGRTISGTSRLGKNCFLELDNGQVLVLHFGMTGDIGAYRDAADAPRFTRVALHLADSGLALAFIDPRKFWPASAWLPAPPPTSRPKNSAPMPSPSPPPSCSKSSSAAKPCSSPCSSTKASPPASATGL